MDKNSLMEYTALLTHKGCMDGSACALCFMWAGGKRENVFFTNPNHEESDNKLREIVDAGYKNIIIADCSISQNLAREIDIEYEGLNIVLLDHHKTAIPLSELKWCVIDKQNTACGSMMLFNYLKATYADSPLNRSSCYLEFLEPVDNHDRWTKNKEKISDQLASLHGIYGQQMFIDRFLGQKFALEEREVFLLELENKKMREYIEEKKKTVIKTKIEFEGQTYNIAFTSGPAKYTNELCTALCTDDVDAVVNIGMDKISIRSKKDNTIDLANLAKKYNGGGHSKASGFSLQNLLGSSLIELVMQKMEK
jgi:oligoribonuclease NrnB/cAMP/cGMP phosphodiesterase (DHH superfamily)